MKGKSVLFLTYWYPNKNSKSFGIFIKRHAHAIKLDHQIVVLSLTVKKGKAIYKKTLEVFEDEAGMETHKIWLESRFYAVLFLLLPLHYYVLKNYILKNLEQKHQFNILHSNILFPCAIVGHYLSKKLHYAHFITEHWTKIDKFFATNIYRNPGRKVYDQAKAITCVSEQLATTVKKHTTNSHIRIVPNIIDPIEFHYDAGIKKNKILTFIAVSYWANFKNPFYFLDALQGLYDEKVLPDFELVMVGKGEQIKIIEEKKYTFKLDLKGAMDAAEINFELNKSHIFLHGSDFETFSVIIAEALLCGLPSVVSPVGIATEAIHEKNGFVTDNTLADWKEKIRLCAQKTYNNLEISEELKDTYSPKKVGYLFSQLYLDPNS